MIMHTPLGRQTGPLTNEMRWLREVSGHLPQMIQIQLEYK